MSDNEMKLSPEKEYLLSLSDDQVRALLQLAKKKLKTQKMIKKGEGIVLPNTAKSRLEKLRDMPPHMKKEEDSQWERYTEELLKLKIKMPAYYQSISDKEMYHRLSEVCAQKMLPSDFAEKMIPSIMDYVRTGRMTPILLHGTPGCGKTTAAKILAEILGLEYAWISAPAADTSHGLSGDSASFVGADMGMVGKAQLDCKMLNPVLIIDEVDKAPRPMNRTALVDELLSLCDGNGDRFTDNLLGYSLNAGSCPIIMTCNDLMAVSEPLRDRAYVFEFPDVEVERMEKIIAAYCREQICKKYPNLLSMDEHLLVDAVDELYRKNIHSIRQHQKFMDSILRAGYIVAMTQDGDEKVDITCKMVNAELEHYQGTASRRIGFL